MVARFLIIVLLSTGIFFGGLMLNPANIPIYQEVTSGIFCKSEETLVRVSEQISDDAPPDEPEALAFYCRDKTGEERIMTLPVMLVLLGFSVGFMVVGGSIVWMKTIKKKHQI